MLSETKTHADLKMVTPDELRAAIRAGLYKGHTTGLAAGKLQCNLVILSECYALDFLRFC